MVARIGQGTPQTGRTGPTQEPAAPKPAAGASDAAKPQGWAPKAGTPRPTPSAATAGTAPASRAATDPAKVEQLVDQLVAAFRGVGTDEQAVFKALEQPPPVVDAVARRYEAKTGESLRDAINGDMSGTEARRALGALNARYVTMGDVGNIDANVSKLFELARLGKASESDLVNQHGVTTNNKIELMVQGKNAFPEVFKAIDGAKDHIHVSYYIFNNDELGNQFADKLIAAKKRGVDVRLTVDGIGSQQMVPGSGARAIINKLEAGGVEVIRNHVVDLARKGGDQIANHPDHRKIVMVDGKVGFTGGMNVGNHYLDEYHDMMIKVEGDAAKQMQLEFMHNWVHLGGALPKGDDAALKARFFPATPDNLGVQPMKVAQHIPGENREIMKTYLDRIGAATKSIYIENPYCTNPDIQTALIAAAKRGVDVQVVLPGESDHGFSHLAARQRYPEMIDAGVKIYEYPGFNHGKVMVTDDKFTTIGSSNLDDVALYHVYEMNLNVDDPKFAKETRDKVFTQDIPKSRLMKKEDITQLQILTGKFWNLFSHAI